VAIWGKNGIEMHEIEIAILKFYSFCTNAKWLILGQNCTELR